MSDGLSLLALDVERVKLVGAGRRTGPACCSTAFIDSAVDLFNTVSMAVYSQPKGCATLQLNIQHGVFDVWDQTHSICLQTPELNSFCIKYRQPVNIVAQP